MKSEQKKKQKLKFKTIEISEANKKYYYEQRNCRAFEKMNEQFFRICSGEMFTGNGCFYSHNSFTRAANIFEEVISSYCILLGWVKARTLLICKGPLAF